MIIRSNILLGLIGYHLDDIGCKSDYCNNQASEIKCHLINTLLSPDIIDFKYIGRKRFSTYSQQTIKVYEIMHKDSSRNMKVSFTGGRTICVYSSRNRHTYCYANDFKSRLEKKFFAGE